jgi:hypothetical protein
VQKYGYIPAAVNVNWKVPPWSGPESHRPFATQPAGQAPEVDECVPDRQTHWMVSPTWIVLVEVPLTESTKTFEGWPELSRPTNTMCGAPGVGVGCAGVGVTLGPVTVSPHPTATRIVAATSRRRRALEIRDMICMLTFASRPYNPRAA